MCFRWLALTNDAPTGLSYEEAADVCGNYAKGRNATVCFEGIGQLAPREGMNDTPTGLCQIVRAPVDRVPCVYGAVLNHIINTPRTLADISTECGPPTGFDATACALAIGRSEGFSEAASDRQSLCAAMHADQRTWCERGRALLDANIDGSDAEVAMLERLQRAVTATRGAA
jgi:hypothetical protein